MKYEIANLMISNVIKGQTDGRTFNLPDGFILLRHVSFVEARVKHRHAYT